MHLRIGSGAGIVVGALALLFAAACAQPSAHPYVGNWERQADSAGLASLTIKPTGAVELQLAHPARPGAGLMKGPAFFHGDTMTFKAASCEPGEARYRLTLRDSVLTIAALSPDGCALRRGTLAGRWVRR